MISPTQNQSTSAVNPDPPQPIVSKLPPWPYGVYSVWRRHAILYSRTWLINFLPPVTEPIFYLLAFGFGLSPMVGEFEVRGEKMNYLRFIGPAMIAVGIAFQSFFESAYGTFIRLRFQRTWHALLTGPLGFREIFFGDLIWATTKGVIAGLVTGFVVLALGQISFLGLLFTLPIIILGSIMFAGIGMVAAGYVKSIDQINVPVFLFMIPMFTFSGTFFPRDNLPQVVQWIAGALPLSQVVDLMRLPLVYDPTWPLDLAGVILWAMLTTTFAYKIIHGQVFK